LSSAAASTLSRRYAAAIAAYKTGRVLTSNWAVNNLGSKELEQLHKETGNQLRIEYIKNSSVAFFYMNTSVAPFDNPKLRQAVNLAIGRQCSTRPGADLQEQLKKIGIDLTIKLVDSATGFQRSGGRRPMPNGRTSRTAQSRIAILRKMEDFLILEDPGGSAMSYRTSQGWIFNEKVRRIHVSASQ
jgi:ABC-type transport system substrate-binding protein